MSDTELTPPPPPSLKAASSECDWTCSECSNINFSWRNSCNRCSKARTPTFQKKKKLGQEIGKQAAEKSRGLFSADDWQCNKCGNVNWARRQQCNVCNAPKFGEVEERTGFGGGYNDRGVVEYKEREDSDDEYDEFGRKKKRRDNGVVGVVSTSKKDNKYKLETEPTKEVPPPPPRAKQEEEEDDEEDEDDGDLSKYDLSDWGDSTDTKKTTNAMEPQNSHRNRRSRSQSRSRSKSRSRSPLSKY